MASIFSDILKKAVSSNALIANSRNSRNWLMAAATKTNTSATRIINSSSVEKSDDAFIGSMLLFQYDPKLKRQLPYYDKFPLIFPFKIAADGFYGINMHYLPLRQRAQLMDSLYQVATTSKTGEMKMRLTYQILNSVARSNLVKPCVKHYLNRQVRSQFAIVPSNEWEIALFLPLERFVGADKQEVYANSIKRQ